MIFLPSWSYTSRVWRSAAGGDDDDDIVAMLCIQNNNNNNYNTLYVRILNLYMPLNRD